MNTFKILNKAVQDSELSSTGFRVLYYLVNMANFKKSDTIELFNHQLMNIYGMSDSQVRRVTNELKELGYLIKETANNPKQRKPNKYTILGQEE